MKVNRLLSALLAVCMIVPTVFAEEDASWLTGRWQMSYDPDNATVDYLEFSDNGDLVSKGKFGEVHGFYTVTPGSVKGVLTHQGKDLLLTFFYNSDRTELRIVTSNSGIETLYRKIEK